jgi:hypothetical protein
MTSFQASLGKEATNNHTSAPLFNLPQGIINYRRNSMRCAYSTSGKCYVIDESPDFTSTRIGLTGMVFTTSGDLYPISPHGTIEKASQMRSVAGVLPKLMCIDPDMQNVAEVESLHISIPSSPLAFEDVREKSDVRVAIEFNDLGKNMRRIRAQLEEDANSGTYVHEVENIERKLQAISTIFDSGSNTVTVLKMKLPYISSSCKNDAAALKAKEHIFSRRKQIADARMKGELDPSIAIDLPRISSSVVSNDLNNFGTHIHELSKEFPILGYALSVDFSLFSGFYGEVTIFLAGDLAGQKGDPVELLGNRWMENTEGRGFYLNLTNYGHPCSGAVVPRSDKHARLLFDLKCAAFKEKYFRPKGTDDIETFMVGLMPRV